jgi:hypothetical protein
MNTNEHEGDRLRAALVPPFRLSLYGEYVPRRVKVWRRPVFIRVYSCPFVVDVSSAHVGTKERSETSDS